MQEQEPSNYQFRHHKHISLDTYSGIGSEVIQLNNPIADRFMAVGDIRSDVVIVRRPEMRALDYDQLGTVRVAKFLQLPSLDVWKRHDLVSTKNDHGTWFIAIDDQGIADRIIREDSYSTNFLEDFKRRFWLETRKGLQNCLIREKLLNAGNYDMAFMVAYFGVGTKDLLLLPVLTAFSLYDGVNPFEVLALAGSLAALIHASYNAYNLFVVGANIIVEKIGIKNDRSLMNVGFREPFIRNSISDLVMPPVPLDRLVRGLLYLNRHGEKFLELKKIDLPLG